MLAAHYAASRTPAGLTRLIIANGLASIKFFSQGAVSLVAKLPLEIQENIRRHEAAGTYDSPEYQGALSSFRKKHFCTLDTLSQEFLQTVQAYENNKTVFLTMYVTL